MKTLMLLLACILFIGCKDILNKSDDKDSATTTTPAAPPKNEHQVGNGGAGVCVAGQCITLTEAGVRPPSPAEEYYQLTVDETNAVYDLAESLPLGDYRKEIIEKILAKGQTYKLLEVEDPQKLEDIRIRYAEILKKYYPGIHINDVQIFAFSGKCNENSYQPDCTYLLPSFFKLDSAQKAKILFHEGNVRMSLTEAQFVTVLELDGLVEDIAKNKELPLEKSFRIDRWNDLIAMYGNQYFRYYRVSSGLHWMKWLEVNYKIIFEVGKVCDQRYSFFCVIDTASLSRYYQVPPSFIRTVSSMIIHSEYNVSKETSESETTELCKKNMGTNQVYSFFYPVRQGVDFAGYKINCLIKNNTIFSEAYKIN